MSRNEPYAILKNMKIGIDARLWNETGVGRYIRNLVTNLSEIGKQNEYVLFVKKGDADNGKWQIANSKWQVVETDIHWHSFKEQVSFAQLLNQQKLDLMHFPYFSLPVQYKRPFVVTIHDLIIHNFATGKASTLPLPLYSLKRLGFKYVFRHALNRSTKIIVPLNSIRSELLASFPIATNKVVVTKEGFDSSIAEKGEVSEIVQREIEKGKYFLYVGNAYPHKNVQFLVDSFLEFQKTDRDYRLLLVGKDDYFYRQFSNQYTDSALSFIHDVSDADLGYLYKNAVAFVSASLMEGFGLPPLEAMACNCLVAVSDIPSFREVCGNNAFYFNPQDAKSLIHTLQTVSDLSNNVRTKKLTEAKDYSTRFSWREMAEQTLKVYESCWKI